MSALDAHFEGSLAPKSRHPADTAGGLMCPEFMALPQHLTVRQALKSLRARYLRLGDERATYVYILDKSGCLTGVLQLRHLVTRPPDEMLETLRRQDVVYVKASSSKYEVAQAFRKHHFLALPVVAEDGKLVGVISADAVLDLVREIASEEMLKLQGVSTDETRSQPAATLVRRRIKWLSINVVLNVIAASVIAAHTETLRSVIALAVFLPILSDMSGVSGMQAVAVSIRDLTLGQAQPKDWLRVIWKELRVGLINGLILGVEIGFVAWMWKSTPMLGVVVGVALWLNIILALCLGGSLPLLIKRAGLDPAIASGPILTTVTDLMGFLIVLTLAQRFIGYLR